MAEFTGQLRPNEVFNASYNVVINQQVLSDNIKETSSLVDKFRTDGSMYGDTKLFYATDVLATSEWGNDAEATNLLKLYRPEGPKTQAIIMDQFRQIAVTIDNYLTKRAWSTEDAFSSFNSQMLAWVNDTKRVYDSRLVKVFVGLHTTSVGKQSISITLPTSTDREVENRLQAQTIAQEIADVFDELTLDETRDYNNYGFLRSYDKDDFLVVWNSDYLNKFRYMDLPTVFHKEGLDGILTGDKLVSRYFGKLNTTETAGVATKVVRSAIEQVLSDGTHVFPGDAIPVGIKAPANTSYTEDSSVICKIIHKDAVKYMSAFQTSTMFFNPKSLTETHYLTFGYGDPTQLDNYPFITISGVAE